MKTFLSKIKKMLERKGVSYKRKDNLSEEPINEEK